MAAFRRTLRKSLKWHEFFLWRILTTKPRLHVVRGEKRKKRNLVTTPGWAIERLLLPLEARVEQDETTGEPVVLIVVHHDTRPSDIKKNWPRLIAPLQSQLPGYQKRYRKIDSTHLDMYFELDRLRSQGSTWPEIAEDLKGRRAFPGIEKHDGLTLARLYSRLDKKLSSVPNP